MFFILRETHLNLIILSMMANIYSLNVNVFLLFDEHD